MSTKYRLTALPKNEEMYIRLLSRLLDEEEDPLATTWKRKLIPIGLLGILITCGGWFMGKGLDSYFKQAGYERHMKLPEEKRPYDLDENGDLSPKEEALFLRNLGR